MKKKLILALAVTTILVSCKTAKLTSYADDVYTSPKEERELAIKVAEERAKEEALEKQKQEEAVALQKAKDDANPYYKDPVYNADDYYDYQYASRINRFSNPVLGASYYDPYYTNCYTYNQNPMFYGTSIYSTYNYWSPWGQFNSFGYWPYTNYNIGYGYQPNCYWGSNYNNNINYSYWNTCGIGYSYNYSPYNYSCYNGYNSYYGYNSGYNNYGYHPYWNNNNWGYFNSADPNSGYSKMQFAQRDGDGGNFQQGRAANPGTALVNDNGRQKYFESVAKQQESNPRFTEVKNDRIIQTRRTEETSRQSQNNDPRTVDGRTNNNYYNPAPNSSSGGGNNTRSEPSRVDRQPRTVETDNRGGGNIFGGGTRITQSQPENTTNTNSGSYRSSGGGSHNSGGGSTNSGGSSSPRGNGGGGNGPR